MAKSTDKPSDTKTNNSVPSSRGKLPTDLILLQTNKDSNLMIQDSFFAWSALLQDRHNTLWPYELVIAEVQPDGGSYRKVSSLVLPLPPESIAISTPVASNLGVSLKGIYEEHNSAPLRNIAMAGTTGVLPRIFDESDADSETKGSAKTNAVADILNKVQKFGPRVGAGATAGAAGRLRDSAGRLSSTVNNLYGVLTGQPLAKKSSVLLEDMANKKFLASTGFAWFHRLSRFLDYYLAKKKTKEGRNLRLMLFMHKDQMYYTCSLRSYSFSKVAGTLEYKYNLQLTAWRRHPTNPLESGRLRPLDTVAIRGTDQFNRVALAIQAIRQARGVVSDSINVLRGIRQDVSDVFIKPLKELALLGKTSIDAVVTAADLRGNIINDLKTSLFNSFQVAEQQGGKQNKVIQELAKKNIEAGPPQAGGTERSAFGDERQRNESFAEREAIFTKPNASPINQIFDDPDAFANLLDEVELDDLDISEQMSEKIDEELERISTLNADYFRRRRDEMEGFISSIVDSFGGGDATYRRIKGLPPVKDTFRKLSIDNALLLAELENGLQAMDSMISVLEEQNAAEIDSYAEFYANLAFQNDIPFTRANSKFWVPFPFGSSLEQLAVQYLGSADRWIEIAAINGLREPFVDENGSIKPFISSASGNIVSVADNKDLYIGQKIIIQSDTQVPTIRKIVAIDRLSSVQTLLRVDGDADLNRYTLEDNGSIKHFLPDTVNSNHYIAIPSTEAVNSEDVVRVTVGPDENPRLIQVAKVDFKLNSLGDLALDSGGDVLRSYGMANLQQAALIRLKTPQQSIVSDPSFGNPIQPGVSSADFDLTAAYESLKSMFLDDPRFADVPLLSLNQSGPGVEITALIDVAESGLFLPVVTQVPR